MPMRLLGLLQAVVQIIAVGAAGGACFVLAAIFAQQMGQHLRRAARVGRYLVREFLVLAVAGGVTIASLFIVDDGDT